MTNAQWPRRRAVLRTAVIGALLVVAACENGRTNSTAGPGTIAGINFPPLLNDTVTIHFESDRKDAIYLVDGREVARGGRASYRVDRQPPFTVVARSPSCMTGGTGGKPVFLELFQTMDAPLADNRVVSFYFPKQRCVPPNRPPS